MKHTVKLPEIVELLGASSKKEGISSDHCIWKVSEDAIYQNAAKLMEYEMSLPSFVIDMGKYAYVRFHFFSLKEDVDFEVSLKSAEDFNFKLYQIWNEAC